MTREQLGHSVVDFCESRRQWITRARADHAAFDQADETEIVGFHDTVPGVRRAGVDAEDDHLRQTISVTSMSKFAQTFCTSSRSSIVSISLSRDSASLPSTLTVLFGTIVSSASAISMPADLSDS